MVNVFRPNDCNSSNTENGKTNHTEAKKNIFKNVQSLFSLKSKINHSKYESTHKKAQSDIYDQPQLEPASSPFQFTNDTPELYLNIQNTNEPTDDRFSVFPMENNLSKSVNGLRFVQSHDDFDLALKVPDLDNHVSESNFRSSRYDSKSSIDSDTRFLKMDCSQRRNSSTSNSSFSGRVSRSQTIREERRNRSESGRRIKTLYELDQNKNLDISEKVVTLSNNFYQSKLTESQINIFQKEECSNPLFPRISAESLSQIILNNTHQPHYKSYHIIDCRFEYEYQGGHIKNAININSKDDIEKQFLQKYIEMPALLIFHCEFSNQRGPNLASHLRNCDRILNYENYPDLCFPDIVILDGGYEKFYSKFPQLCFPRAYTKMDSVENLHHYEKELDKFRKDKRRVTTRNNSLMKLASISSYHSLVDEDNIPNKEHAPTKSHGKLMFEGLPRPPSVKNHGPLVSRSSASSMSSLGLEAPPKLGLAKYMDVNSFNSVGSSDAESYSSRMSRNNSFSGSVQSGKTCNQSIDSAGTTPWMLE